MFLDPPLIIVVLWICRSPLPIHLALETTNLLLIGGKFFAQRLQARCSFPRNQGDGGESQVRANRVASHRMLGLVVGHPREGQLHEVAVALTIRSLGSGTGGAASDQAGVLDLLVETMRDCGIVPVNDGLKLVLFPHQVAVMAFFGRL